MMRIVLSAIYLLMICFVCYLIFRPRSPLSLRTIQGDTSNEARVSRLVDRGSPSTYLVRRKVGFGICLYVPEALEELYQANPAKTLRSLAKIVRDGPCGQAILAAGYVVSLCGHPELGAGIVRYPPEEVDVFHEVVMETLRESLIRMVGKYIEEHEKALKK
jgi:hypothetical protein